MRSLRSGNPFVIGLAILGGAYSLSAFSTVRPLRTIVMSVGCNSIPIAHTRDQYSKNERPQPFYSNQKTADKFSCHALESSLSWPPHASCMYPGCLPLILTSA
jgi:hypothetical protein